MSTNLLLSIPQCFGIHVAPNIYIPAPGAKDENDSRLEILKKALSKNLDVTEERMKIMNLADLDPRKLFFLEGHFLDLFVLTEIKSPVEMPVDKKEVA